MKKLILVMAVLALLCGGGIAQAQLPGLDLPAFWDGTGWIFNDNACGVDCADLTTPPPAPPRAKDPVIGPITGFRFEVLSEERHLFCGVALPRGFNALLDAATFTVTWQGGQDTIQTSTWQNVIDGNLTNWTFFSGAPPCVGGVKSFTITWNNPALFFDPLIPADQRVFPVWWAIHPHDCEATVRMSPIAVPEPSSMIALLCGLTGIGGFALRKRK